MERDMWKGGTKKTPWMIPLGFPFPPSVFRTLHYVYVCVPVALDVCETAENLPQIAWHSGTDFTAEDQPTTNHRGMLE